MMKIRPARPLLLCAFFFAALCSSASATALDPRFGVNGQVAVELGEKGSRANAVLVQPDGRIVAAGSRSGEKDRDFMLFRLLPDGSLDPEFNQDGTVTTAVSSFDDEALTLALQADGKIIAAGYSSSGQNRDFAMVRYNSDGSVDSGFGATGMVVTAVGSSNDEITGVAVQEDGSIVLTGSAQGANGRVAVLARYSADGKPDSSFGEEGFTLSVVGVDAQAESVALSKDGRILLSGSYSDGEQRGLMLLGFDSKGKLDETFGEKGIAVPADSSVFSEGYGMFVNEDGTILVAGSVGGEDQRDAALFRFTAEGQPDKEFEENGVLVSAAGPEDDVIYDVAMTEGAIAAAGFKTAGGQREFLLVTYTKGEDGSLSADLLTTGFSSGKDTATALAAFGSSVVAVGESTDETAPKAAVSKYTVDAAKTGYAQVIVGGTVVETAGVSGVASSNQYVLTGEPYEVTRTTVIINGEVLSGAGDVSERGIVVSTLPNPSRKDKTNNDDTDAPVVTNNTTSTGTSAMSLTTNVDATCKYDTTAGTSYDDMDSTFSTTGAKAHSQSVTDLEDGKTHTYYARCKNTATSKVNTIDTVISFTVGSEGGPKVTNNTTSSVSSNTTTASATLLLTTDVDATCKYGTTAGKSFDEMEEQFTSTGTKTHSQLVTYLDTGKTYSYYARCKNTATGAVNTTDTVISFTVTNSGTTGTTGGPVRTPKDISISKTEATLKLTTDVYATCKYTTSGVGMDYSLMKKFFDTQEGKNHSEPVSNLVAGTEHSYYIRCKNTATDVANTTDTVISFKVDGGDPDSGPKRTPTGVISETKATLKLTTDVAATCKYDTIAGTAYDDMESTISSTGTETHSQQINDLVAGTEHSYYIRCKNSMTGMANTTDSIIFFSVNSGAEDETAAVFAPDINLLASSDQLINAALRNVGRFFIGTAMAQSGCCSSHGGVCGNKCCDGTPLSDLCDGTGTTGTTGTSSSSSTATTSSSSNMTAIATTANGDFIEEGYTKEGSGTGKFTSKLKKLKPGTMFYARAYAIIGGTVHYGNQVSFRTADSCFVATAAFGSVFHPAVQVLRDFRDQFLSGSAAGQTLVNFYYRTSPPLADFISQHHSLRTAARLLLLPVTGAAWLALHLGAAALLLPIFGAVILLLGWQTLRRKTQGRAVAIG